MMFSTPWTQGDTSDWIVFYGSYLGALLGGVVAFGVARIQIRALEKQEYDRRITLQLPTLVQVKLEIEKAKEYIAEKKYLAENKEHMNLKDIDLTMSKYSHYITNKFLWYQIDKIEDAELLKDIIIFRENYFKLVDALAIDLLQLENEIKKIENEIKKLDRRNDAQSLNKKTQLEIGLRDLRLSSEIAKTSKLSQWKKIEDGSYLKEANNMMEKINMAIEDIDKIKGRTK
jgi:hypothetical protein